MSNNTVLDDITHSRLYLVISKSNTYVQPILSFDVTLYFQELRMQLSILILYGYQCRPRCKFCLYMYILILYGQQCRPRCKFCLYMYILILYVAHAVDFVCNSVMCHALLCNAGSITFSVVLYYSFLLSCFSPFYPITYNDRSNTDNHRNSYRKYDT